MPYRESSTKRAPSGVIKVLITIKRKRKIQKEKEEVKTVNKQNWPSQPKQQRSVCACDISIHTHTERETHTYKYRQSAYIQYGIHLHKSSINWLHEKHHQLKHLRHGAAATAEQSQQQRIGRRCCWQTRSRCVTLSLSPYIFAPYFVSCYPAHTCALIYLARISCLCDRRR